MRVFIDANVLVAVLNKEYPVFPYAAKVLSLSAKPGFTLVSTSVCLAIAYYFSEKKHGTKKAKEKISLLVEHLDLAPCGKNEARAAINDSRAIDFEDALQYYAALHSSCTCIVTSDMEGYYFSNIPVMAPEIFLKSLP